MDNVSLFFSIYNFSHKSRVLDFVMVFITNYVVYLALFLSIILAVKGKTSEKKAFLLIILTIPISILLIMVIHLFISEPRPFVTFNFIPLADNLADVSFPSRHATIMAAIGLPYLYLKSKWAIIFLISVILVGFSRIYIGVHYPLDVLGGFLVGGLALFLSLQIKKILIAGFLR